MKVLAMADESTFNSHRKYFRWASQVLSFFRGIILVCGLTILVDHFTLY